MKRKESGLGGCGNINTKIQYPVTHKRAKMGPEPNFYKIRGVQSLIGLFLAVPEHRVGLYRM
jgi:hypothetical protein